MSQLALWDDEQPPDGADPPPPRFSPGTRARADLHQEGGD